MEFNKTAFQQKLSSLIGSSTQDEFGEKCGISRANIFRMLSDDFKSPPSKRTLQKIANGTGASLEDLYVLCGYASSPAKARQMRPFTERIRLTASDMKAGFSGMSKGTRLYAKLGDFLEEWIMLYSHESCRYAIASDKEYDGDLHPGAENCVNCYMKIEDEGTSAYIYFVLYFAKTKGGHYVILDYALDGASLEEAEFATQEQLKKLGFEDGSVKGRDIVYYYRESTEAKLLRSIFGQEDDQTESYIFAFTGFGFELQTPGKAFRTFVEKHKGAFKDGSAPVKFLDTDSDPEVFFKDYEDESTYQNGFQAVVSNAMREETSLPFEYYSCENPTTGERLDTIMIPDAMESKEYDLGELKKIVCGYAKELGVDEFGECISFQRREIDGRFRFSTKEE